MTSHDGEAPVVRVLKRYGAKDEIIQAVVRQTEKTFESIKTEIEKD